MKKCLLMITIAIGLVILAIGCSAPASNPQHVNNAPEGKTNSTTIIGKDVADLTVAKDDIAKAALKEMPKEIIGKDGAEMVLIPAGEFQMGDSFNEGADDERPVHTVYLDAFYIDKYEVTNEQYKKFIDANPQWHKYSIDRQYHDGDYLKDWYHNPYPPKDWNWNDYPSGEGNYPVVYVSWYSAKAYAEWAGKRLPTEAEWEKSARGGLVGNRHPWGNYITHHNANYFGTVGEDEWNGAAPVGSFNPNGYGLYDVAGNVCEWCADWYDKDYYASSPKQNPTGPYSGSFTKVVRGGSCSTNDDNTLHIAHRDYDSPTDTYFFVGFRCVQDVSK